MESSELRIFRAVAQAGSITKAAQALDMFNLMLQLEFNN